MKGSHTNLRTLAHVTSHKMLWSPRGYRPPPPRICGKSIMEGKKIDSSHSCSYQIANQKIRLAIVRCGYFIYLCPIEVASRALVPVINWTLAWFESEENHFLACAFHSHLFFQCFRKTQVVSKFRYYAYKVESNEFNWIESEKWSSHEIHFFAQSFVQL